MGTGETRRKEREPVEQQTGEAETNKGSESARGRVGESRDGKMLVLVAKKQ